MSAGDLDVAVRADDEHAAMGELLAQELEQRQRRRIRPVQIVDDEDERRLLRALRQKTSDRIERAEARMLGEHGPDRQTLVGTTEEIGNHGRGVRRSVTDHELELVRGARLHAVTQDLHPRPVRRCAWLLIAAAPQRQRALVFGELGEHLGASRFADTWLAGEQHDLALPFERRAQQAPEAGKLSCTSDEARVRARGTGARGLRGHHALTLSSVGRCRRHHNCGSRLPGRVERSGGMF